jgi:histidinol-phosphatase (PHP family)
MSLPPDTHVHSEWSWDAMHGSMERTCDRAVQLGLPSIAFTEHLDHTAWAASEEGLSGLPADHPVARFSDAEGRVTPPPLDVEGYLESLERCRSRFRALRIFSGLEVGEPHRHRQAVHAVLATAQFDRVVGSLHTLRSERGYEEPDALFTHRAADQVVRDYLAEIARLVMDSAHFSILGHIDYPLRYWPKTYDPFDPLRFEEEFRHALSAIARQGRILEISTVLPLHMVILRWWREEGGSAVTFGSDAHEPAELARNFVDAAAMAQAVGFHPTQDPFEPWQRRG